MSRRAYYELRANFTRPDQALVRKLNYLLVNWLPIFTSETRSMSFIYLALRVYAFSSVLANFF